MAGFSEPGRKVPQRCSVLNRNCLHSGVFWITISVLFSVSQSETMIDENPELSLLLDFAYLQTNIASGMMKRFDFIIFTTLDFYSNWTKFIKPSKSHTLLLQQSEVYKAYRKEIQQPNELAYSVWLLEVRNVSQITNITLEFIKCHTTLSRPSRGKVHSYFVFLLNPQFGETLQNDFQHLEPLLSFKIEVFVCIFSRTHQRSLTECIEIFRLNHKVYYEGIHWPRDLRRRFMNELDFLLTGIMTRRQNFNGEIVKPAVKPYPNLVGEKSKPHEGTPNQLELVGGLNVEMYRYLRDALNFSEAVAIGVSGGIKEAFDGTANNSGMVKAIASGLADVSVSVYEFMQYRVRGPYGVHFLHAVISARKPISVFVQPSNRDMRNFYGRPYTFTVWILVVAMHITEILVFCTIVLIYAKYTSTKSVHQEFISKLRAASSWALFLNTRQGDSLLTDERGPDSPPDITGLRLALFFGCICSTVLHTLYSSKLTSILTVDVKPIRNFEQIESHNYWIYVDESVPSLKLLVSKYALQNQSTVPITMGLVLPKVLTSKSALLTANDEFASAFLKYSPEYLCSCLSTIQLSDISIKSAQFVKRGSPLRGVFNIKLLLMLQRGVVSRHFAEYFRESSLFCTDAPVGFLSMGLFDTFLPFTLISAAAGIAVLLMLAERIWKRVSDFEMASEVETQFLETTVNSMRSFT